MSNPSEPQLNPIDGLIPTVIDAIDTWMNRQSTEQLKESVHAQLDSAKKKIVMQLLGFTDKWGYWELDNSKTDVGAVAFFHTVQKEAIQEWLTNMKMPVLSATAQKRLEKQISDQYESAINSKIYEAVKKRAEADLDGLVHKLLPSRTMENYEKTVALLNNNG